MENQQFDDNFLPIDEEITETKCGLKYWLNEANVLRKNNETGGVGGSDCASAAAADSSSSFNHQHHHHNNNNNIHDSERIPPPSHLLTNCQLQSQPLPSTKIAGASSNLSSSSFYNSSTTTTTTTPLSPSLNSKLKSRRRPSTLSTSKRSHPYLSNNISSSSSSSTTTTITNRCSSSFSSSSTPMHINQDLLRLPTIEKQPPKEEVSSQVTSLSFGDLQLILDEYVKNLRFHRNIELRNADLNEMEKSIKLLQNQLKEPIYLSTNNNNNNNENKNPIVNNGYRNLPIICMRAVCFVMRYALAYQIQCNDQNTVHIYAKYENQLKEFGVTLFRRMKDLHQQQQHSSQNHNQKHSSNPNDNNNSMDPCLDVMNHLVYLSIAACRACLCAKLHQAWSTTFISSSSSSLSSSSSFSFASISVASFPSISSSSSASSTATSGFVDDSPELMSKSSCLALKRGYSGSGGGGSVHTTTGDSSASSFMTVNSLDNNPASNASHETHQESPASTLSHLSGGGGFNSANGSSTIGVTSGCGGPSTTGRVYHHHHHHQLQQHQPPHHHHHHHHSSSSLSSSFILPSASFVALRAREFAVKSEENWWFYEDERQKLFNNGSINKIEIVNYFNNLLNKQFPLGLDLLSLRFANDSFVVLTMLETLANLLPTAANRFIL